MEPNKQIHQESYIPIYIRSQQTSNRGSGVILLFLLFGILWIYGWQSQITFAGSTTIPVNTANQPIFSNFFIFSAVFIVIGYGLLFTYFKNATATAFFISIFVVSFTILLSPIFQKFWFNIFITNFQGGAPVNNSPNRFLIQSLSGIAIPINFYSLKIALANAISQLVVFTAIYGRLNVIQIVINSLLFNLLWNLNHFLCILLQIYGPDNRIFDDYQISNVYLFAATYGLAATLNLKKHPVFDQKFRHNKFSAILSQIGTFSIFLSFCFTTTLFSLKSTSTSDSLFPRTVVWQEAFLGTFFALSASVISTCAFSILQGGKIGIRESVIGTISGAIIYGSVAGTSVNIGAAIAVGLLGGFLSSVYFQKLYIIINASYIYDGMGLFSTWIVAFIGTFFIAPIVFKTYYNYSVILNTLQPYSTAIESQYIYNSNIAGWVLAYVGISIVIGFLSGLVVSFIIKFFQVLKQLEYSDFNIFDRSYGLKDQSILPKHYYVSNGASATNFHVQHQRTL